MRINYGEIFQQKSKDRSMDGLVNIPADSNSWPESWKVTEYKKYTRFKSIKLPTPISKDTAQNYIEKRESKRDFGVIKNGVLEYKKITLQEISNILYFSCGETRKSVNGKNNKRAHSSAGARYPLEIYIINFEKGELQERVYHYDVENHALEELWETGIKNKSEINKYFGYDWSQGASCAIVITAIPNRTTRKYGERGYKYMYLEAGGVLQNIQNNSLIENICSVMLGATNELQIEDLLEIDGVSETVILGMLLG